ncbi:MAG: hypothetical protein HC844_02350 [Tabrizicola sp.]|nr:hypothetical protein [Tabrizicola sp.]
MSGEYRTMDEIEQDIARNRETVASGLRILQERYSVDGLVRSATSVLGDNAAKLKEKVTDATRLNPIAVAMMGIGLIWLASGRAAPDLRRTRMRNRHMPEATPPQTSETSRPLRDWLDDGGAVWAAEPDSVEKPVGPTVKRPAWADDMPVWADDSKEEKDHDRQ